MKRVMDIFSSLVGIIVLLPFFLFIAFWVFIDSRGGVFYFQNRVGRNGCPFRLIKFRTMVVGADNQGQLTIGQNDSRITRSGKILRKFKLDELPQLINVLIGDMSIVGPRPEVQKYVDLYNQEQKKILQVRPGLTDYASLEYINENEILGKAENPEKTYIETVMPDKLRLNQKYIDDKAMGTDLKIIFKTIFNIIFG